MAKEIIFPFEPSQKVKDAFTKSHKRRIAAKALISELLEMLEEDDNGFDELMKEHPEFRNIEGKYAYDYRIQKITKK